MPTVTIKHSEVCSGGGHYIVTVAGDFNGTFEFSKEELMEAEPPTKREVILFMLRLLRKTDTINQIRTKLQAGVTMTI